MSAFGSTGSILIEAPSEREGLREENRQLGKRLRMSQFEPTVPFRFGQVMSIRIGSVVNAELSPKHPAS